MPAAASPPDSPPTPPRGRGAPGRGARGLVFLPAALGGVAATGLGFYLGMAALMATPAARRPALRWGRPIRFASAAALMLSAALELRLVLPR